MQIATWPLANDAARHFYLGDCYGEKTPAGFYSD